MVLARVWRGVGSEQCMQPRPIRQAPRLLLLPSDSFRSGPVVAYGSFFLRQDPLYRANDGGELCLLWFLRVVQTIAELFILPGVELYCGVPPWHTCLRRDRADHVAELPLNDQIEWTSGKQTRRVQGVFSPKHRAKKTGMRSCSPYAL